MSSSSSSSSSEDEEDPNFDWRNNDHLNSVKSQGTAGNCCYAFVVCNVLEILYHIKYGKHILLSTQDPYNHLVSNAKEDRDGCSYPTILNWIRDNGCVLAEACPYEGTFRPIGYVRQPCLRFRSHFHLDLGKELLYKGKNKHKPQERRLKYEIKQGPVLAEILWIEEMHYLIGGGIYSGPADVSAFDETDNHGVMIVDFGEEMVENKLVKYWVIRNSHGDKWGDNGYAKIDRARTHGRLLIHTAWVIKGVKAIR